VTTRQMIRSCPRNPFQRALLFGDASRWRARTGSEASGPVLGLLYENAAPARAAEGKVELSEFDQIRTVDCPHCAQRARFTGKAALECLRCHRRFMVSANGEVRPEDFYDGLARKFQAATAWFGRSCRGFVSFLASNAPKAGRAAATAGKATIVAAASSERLIARIAPKHPPPPPPPTHFSTHLCLNCGMTGRPAESRDNAGCGCLLLLLFILPGLLWLAFAPKRRRCQNCNSENVVPIDSPAAQKILKDAKQLPGK